MTSTGSTDQLLARREELTIPWTGLFIGGEFVGSADESTFASFDPSTGRRIAEVSEAKAADVDRAVSAAKRAQPGWGRMDMSDRAAIVRRAGELLEQRADEIGLLEALDAGKPVDQAVSQVRLAGETFEYWSRVAHELRTWVVPHANDALNYTLREPVGVVGIITPWNYPLLVYAESVPAALAIGNSVVLKPAEQTPLTALVLAEVLRDAGVPDGVFNVVNGYGPVAGTALVEHEAVAMICFTGSTAVGSAIAERAGRALKRVTLELGGKAPNIIFPDADLEAALRASLFSFSINQGQLCSAGTRLLVHNDIHDEVVGELVKRARGLRVGDPFERGTDLGAVIDQSQLEKIVRYVQLGSHAGAELLTGGDPPRLGPPCEDGWFYRPTVFAGVESRMRIAQDEIFGPVLSVLRFATVEEAAKIANDTMYGLTASLWTRDLQVAHKLSREIEAGTIYVNTINAGAPAPHDRYKRSGLGVTGGREQVEEMTRLKSVYVNLGGPVPSY